ncbi:MAG: RNA-binding domain-containing protein [Thermoproteota archaeon]
MSGIEDLMKAGESSKVEFKKSLSEKEEILKTITAFSNTHGGTVLVGVDDSGNIVGLELRKGEIEELENMISQLIEPKVYPELRLVPYKEKLLLRIDVDKGFNKPYFYRGACYVRREKVTRRLDRDGVLELSSHRVSFDSIIFEGECKVSKILIEDFLKRARERRGMRVESTDPDDVLRKLNLVDKGRLKNGAVLLFSEECPLYFPQAVIKIGYFRNDEVLDEAVIEGPIQAQVEEAMRFIQRHIGKGYVVKGLERIETWEYPLEAIREALVNAVLHRDYFSSSPISVKISDSGIIVENPGELPPPLEIEDLSREHPSIPRNPLISRAFFYMGYFEEWGLGTLRMIRLLKEAGLPSPEFSQSKGFFKVWIKSLKSLESELNDNEKKLLDFVRSRRVVNRKDCELLLKLSERSVRRSLSKLEKLGLIKKTGKGRKTVYESMF